MTTPQEPPAHAESQWLHRAYRYRGHHCDVIRRWAEAEIRAWERAVALGRKVRGER